MSKDEAQRATAAELAASLGGRTMLGLAVEPAVPTRPSGPAVACKVQLSGPSGKAEATVQVATTDESGQAWRVMGKFTLAVPVGKSGGADLEGLRDALAEGVLGRLVRVTVRKAPAGGGLIPATPKGRDQYAVRVENYSSLLLNGVAVTGLGAKATDPARVLLGISLSPRRTLALPVSADSVERFGLKSGVRVIALDLSGL